MQAAHPPLVLVLDEGGVGIFDDDGRDDIFLTEGDVGSDVEFGGEARVLAHADGRAVDVDVEDAFRSAEMEDDAAVAPSLGEIQDGAVAAGRIFFRDARRLVGEGHVDIGVVGLVEGAVQGPVAGDGHLHPRVVVRGIEGGLDEVGGDVFRLLGEMEIPLAVERKIPGRGVAIIGQGEGLVGIGIGRGARR